MNQLSSFVVLVAVLFFLACFFQAAKQIYLHRSDSEMLIKESELLPPKNWRNQ